MWHLYYGKYKLNMNIADTKEKLKFVLRQFSDYKSSSLMQKNWVILCFWKEDYDQQFIHKICVDKRLWQMIQRG